MQEVLNLIIGSAENRLLPFLELSRAAVFKCTAT